MLLHLLTRSRVAAAIGAAALAVTASPASAAVPHTDPVSTNAADYTPQVVATTAVSRPHVDAITSDPTTTYAGGLFDQITRGATSYDRSNLVAFDPTSGVVDTGFNPSLDGMVRAVENAPDGGVYVGGDFKNVNGVSRPALVKLTPAGAINTAFKPPFRGGLVYDIQLVNGHLIVAGSAGKKLMSLNPTTGADDGLINSSITGRVCLATGECSWGTTSVYDFAVSGNRLAAVGNFTQVDGALRSKFFMLDLSKKPSALDPWYYQGFAKECSSNASRRIANLQGIDFNPTGTALDVAATGQIPKDRPQDIWYQSKGVNNLPNTTVCDAIGRFNVSDPTKPAWINYTGGDSMWTVQDTGAAVYVQGHFRWVDNPDGYASIGVGEKRTGKPATSRKGIAAIDPITGLALPWNAGVTTRTGGKALAATPEGLWVGGDSTRFGSERHYGIAFAPLLP